MSASLRMAVVSGPDVRPDLVRSSLWLPRLPDEHRPLRDVMRASNREGQVAIFGSPNVHVVGVQALAFGKEWVALSAAGLTVFAFSLTEGQDRNAFSIYSGGVRSRYVSNEAGRDEGPLHPLEPPRTSDELPSDRIKAIYLAQTGERLDVALAGSREVPVWITSRVQGLLSAKVRTTPRPGALRRQSA
jgi:hypothetical protein